MDFLSYFYSLCFMITMFQCNFLVQYETETVHNRKGFIFVVITFQVSCP